MDKNSDKSTFFSPERIFEFNGKRMDFTTPRVMGILNVTPDSFYDGGLEACVQGGRAAGEQGLVISRRDDSMVAKGNLENRKSHRDDSMVRKMGIIGKCMKKAEEMVREGAYIIDIGAVSTKPGAEEVSIAEEKRRLLPVLKAVRKTHPDIIISADTYRAEIAGVAAGEGADIINDISGGTFDPEMLPTITHLGIPYIIMHIQGTPLNMQVNPFYEDVVKEVGSFLLQQAARMENAGHKRIILDPGFGFGKTVRHNYQLLEGLNKFVATGYPVMAGLSRKSMINRVLNIKPNDALNGTTVLNTIALFKGAAILRVHDVREAVEAVKLVNEIT